MQSRCKKNKVLYLITKSSWGGAQRYVYDLVCHLVKVKGVPATVVAGKDELFHGDVFRERLKDCGVSFLEIKSFGRDPNLASDIKALFDIFKIIKKERPNVVHLNSSKAGILGAVAARFLRVPRIIFTVHGLPYNEERSKIVLFLIKIMSYFNFLLVDKIIVLSKSEKEKISKFFHKKIYIINNACAPFELYSREHARNILFKKLTEKGWKDLDFSHAIVIGSIAELTRNKGLEEFLDELYKVRDKDFLYLHFGSGELLNELVGKTQKLGLDKKVFWMGFDSNARNYLKALDLFTLPSKKEGMPYALLEAGYAGLWIYASPVGSIPEMLDCTQTKQILSFKSCKLKSSFSFDIMLKKTFSVYFS